MADPDVEIKAQVRRYNNIKNFKLNSHDKVVADKRTLSHYKSRLQLLESYGRDFVKGDKTLIQFAENEKYTTSEYVTKDGYTLGESFYIESRAFLLDEIKKLQVANASTSTTFTQNLATLNNDTLNPASPASFAPIKGAP